MRRHGKGFLVSASPLTVNGQEKGCSLTALKDSFTHYTLGPVEAQP